MDLGVGLQDYAFAAAKAAIASTTSMRLDDSAKYGRSTRSGAEWASSRCATFVRPRFGGLREKKETSQGRNSQGRDLAGASVSAGARLLYALLDAPTDLATSIVQRSRNLAAAAIQTFAHNSIAATVQVDPHRLPGSSWGPCACMSPWS